MNPFMIFGLGWLIGRGSGPQQPVYQPVYQPMMPPPPPCPTIPLDARVSHRVCPQCYGGYSLGEALAGIGKNTVTTWRWNEGIYKWEVEKCDRCTFGGYSRCW